MKIYKYNADILTHCGHNKFKIADKYIEVIPETAQYFEEDIKNAYKKTHCIGYNRNCYYTLQCEICGEEIDILEEELNNLFKSEVE